MLLNETVVIKIMIWVICSCKSYNFFIFFFVIFRLKAFCKGIIYGFLWVVTNIKHDVFYKAIEYWIDKFHDDIPFLSRFTKAFILEGLNIILKFNYFYFYKIFFHQIKGTARGTIFAVVASNLTVTYFEVKMFALLPQIYPRDFVDYFFRNYFRFLDDIFHTWLINFDIEPFYKLINELDPYLKLIFEKLTADINFLDIIIKIVDNQ